MEEKTTTCIVLVVADVNVVVYLDFTSNSYLAVYLPACLSVIFNII